MSSTCEALASPVRARAKGGAMGYLINRDDKPLGDPKKGLAAAVRRAALGDDVPPHTLKHTAISWRLEAGVSIWDVSKLFATARFASVSVSSQPGRHDDRRGAFLRQLR